MLFSSSSFRTAAAAKRLCSNAAILVWAASLLLTGCAPVFSDFQSASPVETGQLEVTPSFAPIWSSQAGHTEHLQYNFGGQAAYGIRDWLEIRAGYGRIQFGESDEGIHVTGFGPKLGLGDHAAFYLPIGFAFGNGIEVADMWEIHPTLLYTATLSTFARVTPSGKVLLPVGGENRRGDTLVAFNLGASFSRNFDEWAVRPEAGILMNPGESGLVWMLGLGVSYRLGAH